MKEHSFGCLSDQEAMGLHDLSKAEVYKKPKGVTMFEKAAEERITEQYGTSGEYITRQRIWQDGAEFGYSKGKNEAKEIIQKLIANAPDTYSGTNIELQQKKMFAFQNAVNKAEDFLKE